MEFDYFSVEAILAENQKIQCTFKQGVPGMGHIGGGSERDVCLPVASLTLVKHPTDRALKQNTNSNMACVHYYLFVREAFGVWKYRFVYDHDSDWAEFNIPSTFGSRVRNALKAEPCSVRLSNLVGAGNHWYGFGKTIMDMCACVL